MDDPKLTKELREEGQGFRHLFYPETFVEIDGKRRWDMRLFPDPRISDLKENPFHNFPLIWSNPTTGEGGTEVATKPELDEATARVQNLAFTPYLSEGSVLEFQKKAIAIFDLRRPLAPQFKKLESQVETVLQSVYHPDKEPRLFGGEQNWSRHLRVIDADDQGATPTEIFEVIMGDELSLEDYEIKVDETDNASQAGKNMINAAREIMRKVAVNL